MGRGSRSPEPFNANPDTGRLAYRNPEFDPMEDGRPVLAFGQFWEDDEERAAYERAAQSIQPDLHFHAMRDDEARADAANKRGGGRPWIGMARLCEEITQMAQGLRPGFVRGPGMPIRGWSQKQWRERQWTVKKAGGHAHYEE